MVKKFYFAVSLFFTIFCVGVGVWYFFPLELQEVSDRFSLWKAGVHARESGGLHGLELNHCSSQGSTHVPSEGCSCIAFIHGVGDDSRTWKRLLLWSEEHGKEIDRRFPSLLFAVDLPGFGISPAPTKPEGYRARNLAEQVKGALAGICPRWVLVGNSFGGWVASWVALNWPEGVSRLVLLSPAGIKSGQEAKEVPSLLKEPTVESLKEFVNRAYAKPHPIPERILEAVVRKARSGHSKDVIQAQTEEDYLDGRLSYIKAPSLIIWGKDDRIIPIEVGYRFRDFLRSAIWREVPSCGHLPQKECPAVVEQSLIDMIQLGPM